MIVFNMIYGFLKQYNLWILTSNNPSSTRKDFANFDSIGVSNFGSIGSLIFASLIFARKQSRQLRSIVLL
jgi:hypothetical protein